MNLVSPEPTAARRREIQIYLEKNVTASFFLPFRPVY
jgi:hypothetical protein